MRKILVTGNAGSGKSTTAKIIAETLGVPFVCLDSIVWGEGWQKTTADEVLRKTNELIVNDAWVIDGVSYEAMNAADTVIFLDFPRHVCYVRAAKRNWRYLFQSRPDLPDNCPEILIIPKLVKIIWRFPNRVRPKILNEKARRSGTFIHIRSNRDLRKYLGSL